MPNNRKTAIVSTVKQKQPEDPRMIINKVAQYVETIIAVDTEKLFSGTGSSSVTIYKTWIQIAFINRFLVKIEMQKLRY